MARGELGLGDLQLSQFQDFTRFGARRTLRAFGHASEL